MKKFLALLLAMVLCIGLLAACGGTSTPAGGDGGTGGVAPADLKVGVVHILDPADQGYTYNHDLGAKYMIEQLGLSEDQYIPKFNVGDTDTAATANAITELVEAGCQIVFTTSFGYGDTTVEQAALYPDVEFCHATGTGAVFGDLPNMHNYFAKIHQARYLGGIAAGLKAKEIGNPKLGYVAAHPFAEVISGFTAFFLGAQSVYPEVTMDVIYINSWGDPDLERQAAETLLGRGCGVLSQHSDTVTPAQAAEAAGAFHVGYNNDMIPAAPKASLISARINWGIYMTYAVQCVLDGTPIAVDWSEGLETGAAFLSPLNTDIAAEGTQAAIDAAAAELKGGKAVFAGALTQNGGEPAQSMNWDGSEVVYTFENADSVFLESDVAAGNTSAPGFQVMYLDGITVIE